MKVIGNLKIQDVTDRHVNIMNVIGHFKLSHLVILATSDIVHIHAECNSNPGPLIIPGIECTEKKMRKQKGQKINYLSAVLFTRSHTHHK